MRLFRSATRYLLRAIALRACALALLLSLAVSSAHGQSAATLALLPFENVSGTVDSVRIVTPLIEEALRAKGYQIITPEKIESFLARNRIRNTGMLSRVQLNNLRQEFGVDLALVGTVDLFYESADNPQWGVSSRIVSTRDANVLWAESTGRTGGDYTGLLGLGTITSGRELAREVVKLLFQNLPPAAVATTALQNHKGGSGRFGGLSTRFCGPIYDTILGLFQSKGGYRSSALDENPDWRVAVTIFENASERKGAGRILADVLTTALVQQGKFQVADPGEANEALIELGHTPYGGIDAATLKQLKTRAALDAVFLGTIYQYNEGIKREASTSPEVSLDIRMLDAATGKIVWFASAERSGDDCQIVLDFGIISSILPLIQRTIGEMLDML